MNVVDRLAGSWAGRLFQWLKSWMIPRRVRRWELRNRIRKLDELVSLVRLASPAVAEFGAADVAARREQLVGELVALCRHRWRPNVAWSHLQRCDGCGTDRPATS